jgi:hypothetical protein
MTFFFIIKHLVLNLCYNTQYFKGDGMHILEKMNEYQKEKNALETKASKLKSEFREHITDKSTPLVERWEFFADAGDEFKEHSDWIIQPNSVGLKYVKDNWFDAPEVYGRGKRIDVAECFEDCVHGGELHPESFSYKMDKDEAEKCLTEALEEILEKNLGSFCIDW